MTDLTEKFRKHELPKGFYYVQMPNGTFEILSDYALCRYALTKDGDKIKVLELVPSYEELKSVKETLAEHKEYCCCAKNEVFVLENANLKELLKECQEIIEWYKADCGYKDLPTESVLTKIEEALK